MSIFHLILGAATVLGALYVLSLCLSTVFDYINNVISDLKSRFGHKRIQKDCVAVMVKECLDNGQVSVIGGVFDQTDDTWIDSQAWTANKLDSDLENEFVENDCVTYTIT